MSVPNLKAIFSQHSLLLNCNTNEKTTYYHQWFVFQYVIARCCAQFRLEFYNKSLVRNCLEGNTMRNRGAYSTKERMPSVLEPPSTNQPGRLYLIGGVLPYRQKLGIGAISPAHPRFSRMYGVTNSTVFQTAFVLATVLLMSIAKNLL